MCDRQDLVHYIERSASVRERTLAELRNRSDEEREVSPGRVTNHYFCWFHVIEDELNHRGQI